MKMRKVSCFSPPKFGVVDNSDLELSVSAGEANKQIADYKFKLTKAEQEIASLQASLARSETQVIRYKSTADATEKAEADLKIERRKLQREVSVKVWVCPTQKTIKIKFFAISFSSVDTENETTNNSILTRPTNQPTTTS